MRASRDFQDLIALMYRLRNECAWNKVQSPQSLLPYLLEESYELVEASHQNDIQAIKSELGDVLYQVIFHSEIYQEQGDFDIGDVIEQLMQKLIRRHSFIFEKSEKENQNLTWQEIKQKEHAEQMPSLLSQVKSGSGLMTAQRLQNQTAKVGFDWENLQGVLDKLQEELNELQQELPKGEFKYQTERLPASQKAKISSELGDVLFVLTNLARHLDIDAEVALQSTNAKFRRRFAFVEQALLEQGKGFADVDLKQMDQYWERAKQLEKEK